MCTVCAYTCGYTAHAHVRMHTLTPAGHPRAGISEKADRGLSGLRLTQGHTASKRRGTNPKTCVLPPDACTHGGCGSQAGFMPHSARPMPVAADPCVEAEPSIGTSRDSSAKYPHLCWPRTTESISWVATRSQRSLCPGPTLRKGTGSVHCLLGRPWL